MHRLAVRRSRGFTVIELLIVLAMLGLLCAIALPNFIQFQTRAHQAEAKTNLRAWATLERAYYMERDTYTESVSELGFAPERGNRYAYFLSALRRCATRTAAGELTTTPADNCIAVDVGAHPNAVPQPTPYRPQLTFTGPGPKPGLPGMNCRGKDCPTSAFAVGNIDNDPQGVDTWFVSTRSASTFKAVCGNPETSLAANTPALVFDDETCD